MDCNRGLLTSHIIPIDDATREQATEILSESAIKVAKEKRDRLRKATDAGEEDFISLSLTRRSDDIGPHPDSRLVREEDELGEAEEGKPADYRFSATEPLWLSRVCGLHERSGSNRSREEVEKGGGG